MKKLLTIWAVLVSFVFAAACGGSTTATTITSTASTASPGASSSTATSTTTAAGHTISVTVANGAVSGAKDKETVKVGESVVIKVQSDVADEVHLHGYDKSADVDAGGNATIEFTANIPGQFEVELESRKLTLFTLVVQG